RFPAFEPIPNYPVPRPGAGLVRMARAAPRDLVVSHTRFFLSSLAARTVSRRMDAPWLHIEHGSDFAQLGRGPSTLAARAYDKTLGRLVLRSADAVVGVSRAAAEFVSALSGRSASVLYRGVSADDLARIPADGGLRGRLGAGRLVVYLGRLIEGKGVADLIEAFRLLPQEDSVLCVIGDGPSRAALERRAAGGRVAFLGELPFEQAVGAVKAADVLVNPSYTEGLPTSVMEAALCGRAVIATDVGGTSEVISDGQSGLLVPPHDPDALARALRGLLEDAGLRRRLGELAQAEVTERFDWDRSVDKFLAIATTLRGG
ncbi:MAG: glycosyltransferase family 4 protein, partial [Thermoleophilaceae bacterium]